MKGLGSQLAAIHSSTYPQKANFGFLVKFLALIIAVILLYTAVFHAIMVWEGQEHSILSGLYWTLVTMSTLGYGDIVFQSDVGRLFSSAVVLSGLVLLLALLPFTFIEFFYAPWMRAQENAKAPRKVQPDLKNHVILTNFDPVSEALIHKLRKYEMDYVLVAPDVETALRMRARQINVVVADLDNPDSFPRCGFERAAMVAATAGDFANTSVTFTARELNKDMVIAATATSVDSVDVLMLAGSTQVIQLGKLLGESLARRVSGGDAQSHEIGQVREMRIAEATAAGTPLVGKTLRETKLREHVGVTVIGMWERGRFVAPLPDNRITSQTVLVLAGSREQMQKYDELFFIYHQSQAPVIIIGGGRVGRSAARTLKSLGIDYRIIEKLPERIRDPEKYILGSAADFETLERAGIREAPTVIITSREDDVNIYLTIYCRKLRSDIQLISRATREENVQRLHRAGADFVMSYASMGSNILFNLLRRANILMLAEGLNVLQLPAPSKLVGKTLRDSRVRELSGCSIIALRDGKEHIINPEADLVIRKGMELVLIGTVEAEDKFLEHFHQAEAGEVAFGA